MELWIRWDVGGGTWVLFQRPTDDAGQGEVIATLYEGGIISTTTADMDGTKAWKILADFKPEDRSTDA